MRVEQARGETARTNEFYFEWNGAQIVAYPGESILGALLAADIRSLGWTPHEQRPRGMLCGIGICFECLVRVDGESGKRACVTLARPGMIVQSQSPNEPWTEGERRDV